MSDNALDELRAWLTVVIALEDVRSETAILPPSDLLETLRQAGPSGVEIGVSGRRYLASVTQVHEATGTREQATIEPLR